MGLNQEMEFINLQVAKWPTSCEMLLRSYLPLTIFWNKVHIRAKPKTVNPPTQRRDDFGVKNCLSFRKGASNLEPHKAHGGRDRRWQSQSLESRHDYPSCSYNDSFFVAFLTMTLVRMMVL